MTESTEPLGRRERGALLPIAVGALGPLSSGMAVIYLLMIPLHLLQYEGRTRLLLVLAELLLAAVFLAQRLVLRTRTLSSRQLKFVAAGTVGLPYLSVLYLFALTLDPFYTGFVVVILIGGGAYFLSSRWLWVSVALITTTWIASVSVAGASINKFQLVAVMLAAGTLAVVVFQSRRRALESLQLALARAARELSQREATERTLRESENRLELAITGSRGGWWDIGLDPAKPEEIPDEVFLSPALKQLIGFAADEFPDSLAAWRARIVAEDVEKVESSAREHLAGRGQEHRVEYRIRDRAGEVRWMESHGRIERDSAGRPIRFSGVDRDITERVERERAVGVLSRVVEQSSSIVMITDPDAAIRYVNPKFTRVTGYEKDEVLGRNPRILGFGDTAPEVYAALWATITAGGEWHGELKNRTKSGEPFWVLASISRVTDDAGRTIQYVGVQEDITERKRVEQRLLQSQRLEAVGQLVSGVAHDFNNLLTSILGFSELAVAELPADNEAGRSFLDRVISAGNSAATLTHQLLAVGRQQVLKPRVLDPNTEIKKTEELLQRTLGEDIEVVMTLASDVGKIEVDPTQLQQILLNLAVNARDAMPNGGHLTFETNNVELDESYTHTHPGSRPGPFVMVAISDTGTGMDSDTLKQIFEPFFTTKKHGQGSGLGLATTYGIVKQSGGYIWAYSEPGKGASFKIYLPRVSSAPDEQPYERPFARTAGTETILLVEDADHVRELVSQFLGADGYTVLEAGDTTDALRIAADYPKPIDLLITDLVLPTENGLKLVDRLRAKRKSLRVLLMTGYAEAALRRKHALDPQVPLLTKPFNMHDLAKMVRQLLDRDAPRDEGPGRADP